MDASYSTPTGQSKLVVEPDGNFTVPEDVVQGLLEEASKVLAGNPVLTAQSVGAGLKPIPGDGEPVVGSVPPIHGLHTLFTHSGATLGLILGELLAEEIVTGKAHPILRTFHLNRFQEHTSERAIGTGAWEPVK
ncbi:hypothetical protein [Arthrobacter sp. JCM 19049]|uniref:hypothetical protein n=1 Tax=Arthrobacter sp. JCM 19049 TaxID=1460643 RepID=UPI0024370F1A|nr:hypothetical protein [Arthrobacter sp. JCM 19049]